MSIVKKIFLIVISIIDLLFLIMTIGYIKWGIDMPDTLAGREMTFMGAYILSITMGSIVLILSTILIICFVKWRKKNGRDI